MQPTFLPWMGYFDLMDQADCFVFLDNVQLSQGRSWQKRNRIKTSQGAQWLTIPIMHQPQPRIDEVKINNQMDWNVQHWRTIEQNYRRASSWKLYSEGLKQFFQTEWQLLADFNLAIIKWMREAMGISTPLYRASELPVSGQRSDLLLAICSYLGADVYLSPLGSAGYLRADGTFANHSIQLELQHFEHPIYRQLHLPFMPYLSGIDLLLNEGKASLEIIRSGRYPPYSLANAPIALTVENDDSE